VVSGDHAHLPDIGQRTTDIAKKMARTKIESVTNCIGQTKTFMPLLSAGDLTTVIQMFSLYCIMLSVECGLGNWINILVYLDSVLLCISLFPM